VARIAVSWYDGEALDRLPNWMPRSHARPRSSATTPGRQPLPGTTVPHKLLLIPAHQPPDGLASLSWLSFPTNLPVDRSKVSDPAVVVVTALAQQGADTVKPVPVTVVSLLARGRSSRGGSPQGRP
jgi:hypothetical protein